MFLCHEESAEASHEADRQGNADIEVVVPVSAGVQDGDEVKCYELPGGQMAKTVHKGPYDECGPAYERLFAWVAANGRKLVGPTREIYLNDPNEVAPSEILTEIHAPVE